MKFLTSGVASAEKGRGHFFLARVSRSLITQFRSFVTSLPRAGGKQHGTQARRRHSGRSLDFRVHLPEPREDQRSGGRPLRGTVSPRGLGYPSARLCSQEWPSEGMADG